MPWSASEFRKKFNHKLTPEKAKAAATQANAMLKSGVPEGEAISTASKNAKKSRAERMYGPKK